MDNSYQHKLPVVQRSVEYLTHQTAHSSISQNTIQRYTERRHTERQEYAVPNGKVGSPHAPYGTTIDGKANYRGTIFSTPSFCHVREKEAHCDSRHLQASWPQLPRWLQCFPPQLLHTAVSQLMQRLLLNRDNGRTNDGLPPVQTQRYQRAPSQEGRNVAVDQQPWKTGNQEDRSSSATLLAITSPITRVRRQSPSGATHKNCGKSRTSMSAWPTLWVGCPHSITRGGRLSVSQLHRVSRGWACR